MSNLENWYKKFISYLNNNQLVDGSHDLSHAKRVWVTSKNIANTDADMLVLLAASLFHDLVVYPKDHEKRSFSSIESAAKTKDILKELEFPKDKIENVMHAIRAHSFSANVEAKTLEAKIVQDADRMEALGAIGLARVFYVAGTLGAKLFDELDPFAENRGLDDKKFAIDHFKTKLLKLPSSMQTEKGKVEAVKRAKLLIDYLKNLKLELNYYKKV